MKEMTRTELSTYLNQPYADVIIKLSENARWYGDVYTHPSLGVLNTTFYKTIDSGLEIVFFTVKKMRSVMITRYYIDQFYF